MFCREFVSQPDGQPEKVHKWETVLNVEVKIMGSKEYALVLTDNANPTFYFSKTINEDEFEKVKQDQWVLVDISTFPTKINELLHLCAQRMDIHKSPEVLGNRGYFCTFDIYNNEESYQV